MPSYLPWSVTYSFGDRFPDSGFHRIDANGYLEIRRAAWYAKNPEQGLVGQWSLEWGGGLLHTDMRMIDPMAGRTPSGPEPTWHGCRLFEPPLEFALGAKITVQSTYGYVLTLFGVEIRA